MTTHRSTRTPAGAFRPFVALAASAVLASTLVAAPAFAASEIDPDVAGLQAELARLDADTQVAGMGEVERLKAAQAVQALATAKSRERPGLLYIAGQRVQAAVAAAQADALARQSAELDRERDQILLEASRREAESARREAERLRTQNLARQEESARLVEQAELDRIAHADTFALAEQARADAERARADAEQARRLAASRAREAALAREEAELAGTLVAEALAASAPLPPSRSVGPATVYTLAGTAFGSGRATLTTEANASLRRLAMEVGGRSLEVVGFTDSQGSAAANQALSLRRAEVVAAILKESGASGPIRIAGRGAADPVADNASAEGRAKNRRVEITVR